jgi:hypothetical protein
VEPPLVRIPRHLLHVSLDDLPALGVNQQARSALRSLLAELPMVPEASLSAQLIGPPDVALPCLAVLARHIGQGLRDTNLAVAHDRARLAEQRHKLVFLEASSLSRLLESGDARPARETVLFVVEASPEVSSLLAEREAAGLASFVTASAPLSALAHWRILHLDL